MATPEKPTSSMSGTETAGLAGQKLRAHSKKRDLVGDGRNDVAQTKSRAQHHEEKMP